MTAFRRGSILAACLVALLQLSRPASADYERIRGDILAWQQVPANQALCGTDPGSKIQSLLKNYETCQNFRIVNGCQVTDARPINWNVAILTKSKSTCTGTLLTDKHVAVVAKCMDNVGAAGDIQVLINSTVAEHQHGQYPANEPRIFAIAAWGVHPYFNGKTFENNMAVLELAKPVPIGTDGIRPACLPKAAAKIGQLNGCITTSFGLTSKDAIHNSTTALPLNLGVLDVVKHEVCETAFSSAYLPARQLCAEGTRNGSGTHMCIGDFGSGLLCQIDNLWTMVGMSSYTGSECKSAAAFNDMWSGFTEKNSSLPVENTTPAPANATTVESTTEAPTTQKVTTTADPTTTELPSTTTAETPTEAPTTADPSTGNGGVQVPNVFIGIIQQYLKPFKQFAALVG